MSASVSVEEGVNEWNRQTDDPELSRERAYVLTLLTLPLVQVRVWSNEWRRERSEIKQSLTETI